MTASLPPGRNMPVTCDNAACNSSSSLLTWMRMARNERVAGCLLRSTWGTAALIRSASSLVDVIARSERRSVMARAMRPAYLSSPYCRSTLRISVRSAWLIQSAALVPVPGFILMSSIPSLRKLKPREASSSCGEETPRSNNRPSTLPRRPACPMTSSRRVNVCG